MGLGIRVAQPPWNAWRRSQFRSPVFVVVVVCQVYRESQPSPCANVTRLPSTYVGRVTTPGRTRGNFLGKILIPRRLTRPIPRRFPFVRGSKSLRACARAKGTKRGVIAASFNDGQEIQVEDVISFARCWLCLKVCSSDVDSDAGTPRQFPECQAERACCSIVPSICQSV